ncbi:MAG: M42 family metallopeptidase [Caldisericia bacterium]|nr:M42 family metallopeptidase [Caldisericia bacterium]
METLVDINYMTDFLVRLCNTPSPTGFTHQGIDLCEAEAHKLGYSTRKNNKGGLIIEIPGEDDSYSRIVCGHVDTLGAMVRSIDGNGWLKITPIGGYMMQTVEGEYCIIHTRAGKTFTGTCLSEQPSVHVFADARTLERKPENMVIRLDEKVKEKKDTEQLGIAPGDFISWDARTMVTDSGFIKTRHLDDKAGVAVIFGALEGLKRHNMVAKHPVFILIANYEEVGHGSSAVPKANEILAVDMGAIGADLGTDEYCVSICAKDSSGPYDFDLTTQLIQLAKQLEIKHAVDIYPFYGSDASAALHGGNDMRAGLMGPGVQASHSMERTHKDAVTGAAQLLLAYLRSCRG